MSATIVIGAQWGDEGKGKVVDILAEASDLVVRFQGGNNAGHTLVIDGVRTVLHHIPSGILQGTLCVLAGGVVVDPKILLDEIEGLKTRGFLQDPKQLTVGEECSVIMPYHRVLDAAREASVKGTKIGTTGRGIGPCYEDRVARRAVFVRDLTRPDVLREKIEANLVEKNAIAVALGAEEFDAESLISEALALGERLKPYVRPAGAMVRKSLRSGEDILFEGAQGTLLDVGLGTYPFVTSSHTVSASACVGTGIPPNAVTRVVGITKAYCTRVGEGPFPTELFDETGEFLRKAGAEFGSTTGRPRRCGWLDIAALRYACDVNGFTELAVMKLDVLSGIDTLKVCVGYRTPSGERVDEPPLDWRDLEQLEPIYEELPGWSEDITEANDFSELPEAARSYIEYLEEAVGVHAAIISVGPGRKQTFER